MIITVSGKGRIVLPAGLRRRDGIRAGQQFEIERAARGEYRLRRKSRRRNAGLVALLLACPVKVLFQRLDRTVASDEVRVTARQ